MSERRVDLGEATRRAVEEAAAARRDASGGGEAPRPGDLYVLPATAEHGVEWLVVAGAAAGRWVVLPADLATVADVGEVEVPADEPGGPLTIHGGLPVTVPAALLRAELRSGHVREERRAAAERRWRQLAGGEPPRPRHDPEDRRRFDELAAAQRALAAAAAAEDASSAPAGGGSDEGGGEGRGEAPTAPVVPARRIRPAPSPLRPPPWMTALAAVLALSVVGLAGWNLRLLRQVDELSGARQVARGPVVVVDDVVRGEDLAVPDADFVVLSLVWTQPPGAGERFSLSVVSAGGEELEAIRELVLERKGEASVELPRRALRTGARLHLFRLRDELPPERILDHPIRLADD